MCLLDKVGHIQITSQKPETNALVSETLGRWLSEQGWAGLVEVSCELSQAKRTRFGFNEAKIRFTPGEFQSNEAKEYIAEIPFDLNALIEELELWLTEASRSSLSSVLGSANQPESDVWTW